MTDTDIASLAASLSPGERDALAALPIRDTGYLSDENWWLFYALLDGGLLAGGHDMVMRPTALGEAVLRHLATAPAA